MTQVSPPTRQVVADVCSRKRIYEPITRPCYAAWAVPWRSPTDSIYLQFIEKRRAANPMWRSVPLDFYEGMMTPVGYHTAFCNGAKSVVGESVIFRSDDEARTFREVGRSPTRIMNLFCWCCLSDGSILRVVSDDYVAFDPNQPSRLTAEVSIDEGSSWEKRCDILADLFTYTYRLKRLLDGTLVLVAPYAERFGPGQPRSTRLTKRRGVEEEMSCGVFMSRDEGHTWSGPLTAFPGFAAWEPDFVELPGGDLLFINSAVQGARQARQIFFRKGDRFVPGPVLAIESGEAPETMALIDNGLLVGAIRNGDYVCSNDLGVNWYKVDGLQQCLYQPYILPLKDEALLCVWHKGGDNTFGEVNQYIGADRFKLQAQLPKPSTLSIERLKSPDGSRYINAFRARLTVAGRPAAGMVLQFGYHLRYTEAYQKTEDPREDGNVVDAVTDAGGCAVLDLRAELDSIENFHQQYRITAWYEPGKDSEISCDFAVLATRSDIYLAYTQTMTREELAAGVDDSDTSDM